uniref:Cystinosin n=1 Tax=Photinus pyralis TaxID=7054 RepID=A0A1Y1KQI1_PHOPY
MGFAQLLMFSIIICINLPHIKNEVTILVDDLNIPLYAEDKFVIEVRNVNVSNARLNFVVDNADIVEIIPSSIGVGLVKVRNYVLRAVGKLGGRAEVVAKLSNGTGLDTVSMTVIVYKKEYLCKVSMMVGWVYFFAWSMSYYPQVRINHLRQSVIGPHIDYFVFSFLGIAFYALFNVVLYLVKEVQDEYLRRFPGSLIPVRLNDVLYSVHGTFMSLVIVGQFIKYEGKTNPPLSITAKVILGLLTAMFVVMFLLSAEACIPWLDFLNFCSSAGVMTSLIRFIPQVLANFKHKSVIGVSITTVIFDIVGGFFSTLQMCVDSYNYDDWISVFGNFTKFGLGLSTLLFDGIILLQYYVLYRDKNYVIH